LDKQNQKQNALLLLPTGMLFLSLIAIMFLAIRYCSVKNNNDALKLRIDSVISAKWNADATKDSLIFELNHLKKNRDNENLKPNIVLKTKK
jgi:hypothetical protein